MGIELRTSTRTEQPVLLTSKPLCQLCKNYYNLFICSVLFVFAFKPEESTRLWATVWLLGIELWISGRVASAFNYRAISLAPLGDVLMACNN